MEKVLEVYKRPYDQRHPVVCMDESSKQLVKEVITPIPASPSNLEKQDYEYERNGVCNVFMVNEPLTGKRYVEITERKTKKDWGKLVEKISNNLLEAEKITLLMDNYATHTAGALYEVFEPAKARALLDRFEFVYTPKHGSWLNMAEIELNVLMNQCLNRRISCVEILKKEVKAWQEHRNNKNSTINWQFKTEDARIKLRRLYPTLDA